MAAAMGFRYWMRKRVSPFNLVVLLFTLVFMAFFLFPFYWQLTTAVRTSENLTRIPPQFFPNPIDMHRFVNIFQKTTFPISIRNSLIIALFTTAICLSFSVLSSYAIARLNVPGSKAIMFIVLVISMLPGVSIIGPLYLVFKNAGIINTRLCLVIAYTAFFLPFAMWFLSSFFRTIPPDLEEAATIDGCTPLQALLKIIIPLSTPAVFTILMMIFINSWNEFLFAFTFTSSDQIRTYPVGLIMFRGLWNVPWGDLCAGSVVVATPIVLLVLVAQRYIIQGLTAGAMKG